MPLGSGLLGAPIPVWSAHLIAVGHWVNVDQLVPYWALRMEGRKRSGAHILTPAGTDIND